MVEEDTVASVDPVGLAVVHRDPVGIHLGDGVGAARVEGGRLGLGRLLHEAIKLRGRGLVEAGLLFQPEKADRLEQAQRADGVDIRRVFRRLEADRDMGLRAKVVDLVGLHLGQDPGQVRGI